MEPHIGRGSRSTLTGPEPDKTGLESRLQEDIRNVVAIPHQNTSSFTALLGLPANQAIELLQSPDSTLTNHPATRDPEQLFLQQHFNDNWMFRSDYSVIKRAEKCSVPSNSSEILQKFIKHEHSEMESCLHSPQIKRLAKRREREKKVKGSSKKNRSCANESGEDAEKLPYVHVRARRGQATDSHSLAERARREKINARMKLLQELVPGCSKISGTALVLDEIINHVQSLQRQVEFLSMRLAAVNPRIDYSLYDILDTEGRCILDVNFPGALVPMMWMEGQINDSRHQFHEQCHLDMFHPPPLWGVEDDPHNFVTREASLLSYDSPNSASFCSNQLKPE